MFASAVRGTKTKLTDLRLEGALQQSQIAVSVILAWVMAEMCQVGLRTEAELRSKYAAERCSKG